MKLTNADKEFLLGFGCLERDFPQIERAFSKTTYTMNGKRISRQKAIELLGYRPYLLRINRSAFHWNATGCTQDGQVIYFDSSKLFQEV